MSGIPQVDVLLKAAIELSFADIKKNPWIIDHVFSTLKQNPFLSDKYGQANIDSCKEWIQNNQIDIYLRPMSDKDRLPNITIYPGSSSEKEEMKTEGDLSVDTITLMPGEIGKPIPYIIKPFIPVGYDNSTGEVFVDPDLVGLNTVVEGQLLIDTANGNGYIIESVEGNAIIIAQNQNLSASQLAVVPKYPFYKARIEHTFYQENFVVSCSTHGDPQTVLWLHSLVLYSLLRYREVLLEGNGLTQSVFSNSELMENQNFAGPDGEQAFTRNINVSCMAEYSWIKSPKRIIEAVALEKKTSEGIIGGVKIITDIPGPSSINPENEIWYTGEDSDDEC